MKVYITYEKDGYDSRQVEKVFIDESTAQDHVIGELFSTNCFYDGKQRHELEELALEHIECHDVISD